MSSRIDKISQAVKKELSDIIRHELKDPRIPDLASVVSVDVTGDLREATAYISVYAEEDQKKECLSALNGAQGFIRKELGNRLTIRYTPKLKFKKDNSIERGAHLNRLFEKIKSDD